MERTLFDELMECTKYETLGRVHNTTNMQGDELHKREFKNGSQTRAILNFFQAHSYESFTPWEIQKAMNLSRVPITSIRRAITDLTDMGYLIKTDIRRVGDYGEMCYAWTVK